MKRFLTTLAVATAIFTLSACGGKKENPEIEAKIVKFEQVCDKAADLGAKVKAGDMSVANEYAEVAMEMSEQAQDLAGCAFDLTPEQAERMEKAANKAAAAVE